MRTLINSHIPLDAVARWWYLLVAGTILGYLFSIATGQKPFSPLLKGIVAEGPPARINTAVRWITQPEWKDDLFFAVLGFAIACTVIWLLEEIRAHRRTTEEP